MRTGVTQAISFDSYPDIRVLIGATGIGFTSGHEDTVYSHRLLKATMHEMVYGGKYTFLIDNSDDSLTDSNFVGYPLGVYIGFDDGIGSNLNFLKIVDQHMISYAGKLVVELEAVDYLNLLSMYKGSVGGAYWNHFMQKSEYLDTLTLPNNSDVLVSDIPELYNAIIYQGDASARTIVTSVISDTLGKTISRIDYDVLLDSKPFVSAQDARSTVSQALVNTNSFIKLYQGEIRLFNPLIYSTVYTYSNSNTYYSSVDSRKAIIPNTFVYFGINEDGELIHTYYDDTDKAGSHGVDWDSVALLGHIIEYRNFDVYSRELLSTQTEVDGFADAALSKLQMSSVTGEIEAPMHCSQELFDKVKIWDSRYDTPHALEGYVFEILREYEANKGIYKITLGIGGLSFGFSQELDSELTSPEIKKNNPPPFTGKISPYPPEHLTPESTYPSPPPFASKVYPYPPKTQGGGGYSSWEQGGGGSSSWNTYPNPAPHP